MEVNLGIESAARCQDDVEGGKNDDCKGCKALAAAVWVNYSKHYSDKRGCIIPILLLLFRVRAIITAEWSDVDVYEGQASCRKMGRF